MLRDIRRDVQQAVEEQIDNNRAVSQFIHVKHTHATDYLRKTVTVLTELMEQFVNSAPLNKMLQKVYDDIKEHVKQTLENLRC